MVIFDVESFSEFLGDPIHEHCHAWGQEYRYRISEDMLAKYQNRLRDTLYHHHSSFDLSEALTEIGYPLVAKAMHQRNDGNPGNPKTRMGNLGEVIGDEFMRAFLEFETHSYFPKRFNPNVEESIRGVDIIGLSGITQSPSLLFGEAKCRQDHNSRFVIEAYEHLKRLDNAEQYRLLRSMKEYLYAKGDRHALANVDRHMKRDLPRQHFLLSITQSAPLNPFDAIDEQWKKSPLPSLLAVHIQFCKLKKKPEIETDADSWLTRLFEP